MKSTSPFNLSILAIAGLAASSLLSAAHAQSASSVTSGPWYAGGSLGTTRPSPNAGDYGDQQGGATTNTGTGSGTSWKLYGGYQFTPNWGVELQYADLAKYQNSYSLPATNSWGVGTNKLSAWSLAGTGTWPINDAFSLHAKAGVAFVRNDYSFSGSGPSYLAGDSGSDHSTNLTLGLGAKYKINRNFAIRFDYENFGRVGQVTNNLTIPGRTGEANPSLLSAGVQVNF